MRFYTQSHQHWCGIDLHARSMYTCILDARGEVVVHRDLPARPDAFLEAIAPYRDDVVVGAECIFTWYWLADLCEREKIPFVLGHALYMRAHGAKTKNDRIDSRKIAGLLRGGMFPMAYVYPARMRGTRDLMRRRNYLVRHRADLLTHLQNTNSQYNLPEFGHKLNRQVHHEGVAERFTDPAVRKGIEVDLELIDQMGRTIESMERSILRLAREEARQGQGALRSRAPPRPRRLLHAHPESGLRPGSIPGLVTGGDDAARRLTGTRHGTSRRGYPSNQRMGLDPVTGTRPPPGIHRG